MTAAHPPAAIITKQAPQPTRGRPRPTRETEICLAGPFSLALLRQAPWLSGLTPARQQLRAIYFDTNTAQIARIGAGLRIRRESGNWVQTLKFETKTGARVEFNHRLHQRTLSPFPQIDPHGMPSGTDLKQFGIPKSAIQALTETSTLLPLFEVQVTRYRWVLHREEGVIELAFDKGTVAGLVPDQSGAEPVAVNELEFELVSGSPKALWTIASEFLRWMPDRCGLEPRSKAQRGLESVFAQKVKKSNRIRSRPSLVNKIPLNHGENQDHDLGTVLRHHLQTATVSLSHLVVQAQRRINPEDVHQSRVALRQIRTLLKLLVAAGYPVPAQDLLPRCAALADELGALRDLDVLTESLLDPLHQKLPHDRAFTALCKAVREHQSQVRLRVRQHLADTEVPLLLCDLGLLGESLPDSPVGQSTTEFARTEADRLRKKIRRRQRACQTMPSAEADHRLRLAHKALRYASPLLRDLKAPQDLTAWAKASAKAQEALGLAQDKATALQTIALALQAQPTAPAARERALALIEGYLLAE